MTEAPRPGVHGLEQIPLHEYAGRASFDDSIDVVPNRALPFLGDGLTPVQRRRIDAMRGRGLNATAEPTKRARTVADVIGRFHPHGHGARCGHWC